LHTLVLDIFFFNRKTFSYSVFRNLY